MLVLLAAWLFQAMAAGAEFKLTNGDIIKGEASSINSDGLMIRMESGGFTERYGWGLLTQETLKMLQDNPQAKKFVEPFIEVPVDVVAKEKARKKEIVVKEPPKLERPQGKSFVAGLMAPAGFLVLGILYFGNLYSAYHIAQFRSRPVALVVGLSAVLPVLGPIIFLLMPDAEGSAPPAFEPTAASTEVVSA